MIKYYLGLNDRLYIAKTISTNMKQNTASIHVYYSDFIETSVGAEETIELDLWNDNWFKLDAEGKIYIIKRKFNQ